VVGLILFMFFGWMSLGLNAIVTSLRFAGQCVSYFY